MILPQTQFFVWALQGLDIEAPIHFTEILLLNKSKLVLLLLYNFHVVNAVGKALQKPA